MPTQTISTLRARALRCLAAGFAAMTSAVLLAAAPAASSPGIRKLDDVTLYADARFHSAFPSIVRRPDGELLVAFRRAPDRRLLGDEKTSHTDPNSYLVTVRSRDAGKTWTKEPQLMYAHPYGGSQDPCMVQLRDGTIVCASYGWAWMPPAALPKLPKPNSVVGERYVFLGGYLLRSTDGGHAWSGPLYPPRTQGDNRVDIYGQPLPAYNRGAMCEGADGRLYWVVAMNAAEAPRRSENHLLVSADKGLTWSYASAVAVDSKVTFNETSIYETPKGDLVAFIRTADFNDHVVMARSKNKGQSFEPWTDAGFQGHPLHATRLPDNRVLLVYGYRHKPYGIRARVLNAECTDAATAPEVVLRDDGGGTDLGYPWVTMIDAKRALVVYYFNKENGPRTIEGTFVQVE
ncbi:sialidase family protein [Horticoccus sp. 23ND18S-11]|uniref:sialidase family protein n=1 Tax=Horticoccus sp. 23ND18S-11 TaxID=3391832 RepID=UPI0039C8FC24